MTQALMTLLFFLLPLHIGSVSGESDPCATRSPEGKIVISPSAVIKVAQLIIRNHMPHDSFFLYRSVSGESDPCATRSPEGKIVISPSAVIKVAQLIIRNHMPHDSFFLYRFC